MNPLHQIGDIVVSHERMVYLITHVGVDTFTYRMIRIDGSSNYLRQVSLSFGYVDQYFQTVSSV
jgi:hypothetical protein